MCICNSNIIDKCPSSFTIMEMYDYYDGVTEGIVQCTECLCLYYFRVVSTDFYTECIRLFHFTEITLSFYQKEKAPMSYGALPVTHIAVATSSLDCFYLWTKYPC